MKINDVWKNVSKGLRKRTSNKSLFAASVISFVIIIALVDLLFYFLFFQISPALLGYITPGAQFFSTMNFFGLNWLAALFAILLVPFTYFFMVLIYTLCKYLSLSLVPIILERKKVSFSSLPRFFRMNLLLPALLMLVTYLLMPVLRDVPRINILGWAWLVFLSFLFIFLYMLLNVRHSLFASGRKYSYSAAIDEVSRFSKYRQLLILNVSSIVGFFAFFLIIGYAIQYLVKSFKIGANIYNIYDPAFGIAFGAFFYVLFFFNRAYFYYAAKGER